MPENEQSDNDDKITLARVNTTKIDNKSGISVCPQIPPNLGKFVYTSDINKSTESFCNFFNQLYLR